MNNGSAHNQKSAQDRAEVYYTLYASMGSSRSLTKLQRALADVGLDVSLNTLKTYSANNDWNTRIKGLPTEQENSLMSYAVDMQIRQSALGRLMQTLGHERLKSVDPSDLSINDALRLMQTGVQVERAAMGEATERVEIFNTSINPLIHQIISLFVSINSINDPEERKRRFAIGADELILNSAERITKGH
jgi:hypothetical protein